MAKIKYSCLIIIYNNRPSYCYKNAKIPPLLPRSPILYSKYIQNRRVIIIIVIIQ